MFTESYGILDIRDWLLDEERSAIRLPAIQRGFVWRAAQVENLWDSIFREYPVGAFLLSHKEGALELFDGQQRATSIALGFYNPWEEDARRERIGNDRSLPTVWVDLDPVETDGGTARPITPEGSVHLVRVLTKSHPWGYRARNNYERLYLGDRTKAWDQLRTQLTGMEKPAYTALSPGQRAPYSARVPVPLCFLLESALESASAEDFRSMVLSKCLDRGFIAEAFQPYFLQKEGLTYREGLEGLPSGCWDGWRRLLRRTLDKATYCIPAVIVDEQVMNRSADASGTDDPTLFVRLNSGGTNLQGEELLYSIFKASYPEGKDLVESVSVTSGNLIAPSRIIALAARLVIAELEGTYQKGVSPRAFQARLADGGFRAGMRRMVEGGMADLVGRAVSILSMEENRAANGRFVPDIVVKTFIRESPEGVLLLMNYLRTRRAVDAALETAVCRRLYRNYWFGNLEAICRRCWNESATDGFWTDAGFPDEGALQLPLVSPGRLEAFLLGRVVPFRWGDHGLRADDVETEDIWDFYRSRMAPEDIPAAWADFLWRLLSANTNRNKALILLAQREYIRREFSDYNQLEDLQDTNTPWDWDHIFPKSWAWGESDLEKEWMNRIGNFRAMSLVDNRSENNNLSPARRLSPEMCGCTSEDDAAFRRMLRDYCVDYAGDYPFWKRIQTRCRYCPEEGKEDFERTFATAVILRTVNIYRSFYELFEIPDWPETTKPIDHDTERP